MTETRETFVQQERRNLRERIHGEYSRVEERRQRATSWMQRTLEDVQSWEKTHKIGLILFLMAITFATLAHHSYQRYTSGTDKGEYTTGLFVIGIPFSLAAGVALAVGLYLFLLLTNRAFMVIAPAVLFPSLALWAPLYALWAAVGIACKGILLIILTPLWICTRIIHYWKRITHVCPNRNCGHRGESAYLCPDCQEPNRDLWPNRYGLLRHECARCQRPLWALDILGRVKYQRVCANPNCGIPRIGRHAGKVPERLVALVGGPASGKTCYLLMAVSQILDGTQGNIRGKIDDIGQETVFHDEWAEMCHGLVPARTSEVPLAFLLYTQLKRSKFQLFLYDAPGEEFGPTGGLRAQQYFPLIEGILLMVDPLTFEAVRSKTAKPEEESLPFEQVAESILLTALRTIGLGAREKIPIRVAIVISKTDVPSIQAALGSPGKVGHPAKACREALVRWGAESTLRKIELKFSAVEYFACTALGRPATPHRPEPFAGIGVLEPLSWILTGERRADS